MMRPFVMLAWVAISLTLATCGAHGGGNDGTRVSRGENGSNDETRAPRGAGVKFTPELVLTSSDSKPRGLDPSHDYVAKGDTIEAFITPEEDTFVYLGYCNGGEFALYPPEGRVLRAEAKHRFKIPDPYDIDDDRVLYVIVSRTPVSLASPDLAIAIAQSRQAIGRRAMDGDCAGGPGDGAGSQTSSVTPTDLRLPEPAIRVVRYEFLRRP
jgi:hypothetical protein